MALRCPISAAPLQYVRQGRFDVRVLRLLLLGVLAAAALGFLLRMLAPRHAISSGEVGYQAPLASDDSEVTVQGAVPLIPVFETS